MTVLKKEHNGKVELGFWSDELEVTASTVIVTLKCDWPGCGKEVRRPKTHRIRGKMGWRYCGTGKRHLCESHSDHTDEELCETTEEEARK